MSESGSEIRSNQEEEEEEEGESFHEHSPTPTQQDDASCFSDDVIDQTKADITILCDLCQSIINVNELTTHTMYHNALKLYKFKEVPSTVEILLTRRDHLIRRMQRSKISEQSYLKYVKTINDTFQILRRAIEPYSYRDDAFIYDNQEASEVQGLSFIPRNRLFLSIGMCTSHNKQYKVDMEDTMRFIDCFAFCTEFLLLFFRLIFGGNEKFAYIGLFDGYNGKTASLACRDHLHEGILLELSKFFEDMNSSEVEDALINRLYTRMIDPLNNNCKLNDVGDVYRLAYLKMDHLLSRGMHETSSVRWSGTSVFTALIEINDKIEETLVDSNEDNGEKIPMILGRIHVANCGNVEALGIRPDGAFLMTQKHALDNKRERERVLETGLKISENNLIDGVFETTRGLGNHGDKDLKKCVINSPYFQIYEIDPTVECIILATEGLWQALSYDVVVDIITQCLPSRDVSTPNRIHTAVQSVLEKYDPSTIIPYTIDEDEIVACMNEILFLFEDEIENDYNEIDKMYFSTIRNRAVQCSENEIRQDIWNALPDKYRLRLELAQTISERLVAAALLAQSKANISVICLLLPGAAV